MASKRYINAFDDEEAADCPESLEAFLSDSGEDSYVSDREPVVEPEIKEETHEKKMERLNDIYKDSLNECYETLKDKLTWVKKPDENVCPPKIESFADIAAQQDPWVDIKVKNKRFNNKTSKPLDVNVSCELNTSINFSEQPKPPKYDKMCKFIAMNKPCPFGDEVCRFSHVKQPYYRQGYRQVDSKLSMTTAEGKTKKIWMCRNVKPGSNCKYGNNCPYAHSFAEIRDAVIACNKKAGCNRVRFDGYKYVNSNNEDRRCMRLHPKETIANFVERTS